MMTSPSFLLDKNKYQESKFGLGTMMLGWRLGKAEFKSILKKASEADITLIDTSVSYSKGLCHQLLGESLHELKLQGQFSIATKVGGISQNNDPPENIGYSKKNIIRQCELSLSQLGIDCIDLLQLHNPSDKTHDDEILDAIYTLIRAGKIRDFGVCNFSLEQFKRLASKAHLEGINCPTSNQIELNLLKFKDGLDFIERASELNCTTISWGALSSGLLNSWSAKNSKIIPDCRISNGRERESKIELLNDPDSLKKMSQLNTISLKEGIPVQLLSIAWIRSVAPKNCIL
jgi:aryl-alcohol dehydrogenase-like predicted oxidoreductase